MIKIAVILPSLANKGPVIVAHDVISGLVKHGGFEVTVFYFDNLIDLKFPCRTKQIKFFEKINFEAFDIIHSHQLRPNLYVSFWKKNSKKLCITTLHQDIKGDLQLLYNKFLASIFEKIWLMSLKKQDAIVFVSSYLERKYQKYFPKKELKTIFNGRSIIFEAIPEQDEQIITQLRQQAKYIICTAAPALKRKGIDQIISALSLEENFGLLMIGDGEELENLKRQAQDNKVANRCALIGYRPKAYNYYKYADLCVFSSISEGLSLSVIEASAAQKPIICSDIESFTEMFKNEEVLFYSQKNFVSLSGKLKEAILKKEELELKIREKYQHEFTSEVMSCSYIELYMRLITKTKLS